MGFEIRIIEGHDPSSFFWFRPVSTMRTDKISDDEVIEYEEEFSIEESDIYCFLHYFFFKYFDNDLVYNKERFCPCLGYTSGFDWNLTYNFYTYESLKDMIQEIRTTATMLEIDCFNPILDEVKQYFPFQLINANNGNNEDIKKNTAVVIGFYNRFCDRLFQMMMNNPQASLISIMGP